MAKVAPSALPKWKGGNCQQASIWQVGIAILYAKNSTKTYSTREEGVFIAGGRLFGTQRKKPTNHCIKKGNLPTQPLGMFHLSIVLFPAPLTPATTQSRSQPPNCSRVDQNQTYVWTSSKQEQILPHFHERQ